MTHLTAREAETLRWLSNGKTNLEIGLIMRISRHGVDKHMRALREKFGASTRVGVVVEAFHRGLLPVRLGARA